MVALEHYAERQSGQDSYWVAELHLHTRHDCMRWDLIKVGLEESPVFSGLFKFVYSEVTLNTLLCLLLRANAVYVLVNRPILEIIFSVLQLAQLTQPPKFIM